MKTERYRRVKVLENRMKTVCKLNQCAGCMACVDICPKEAIHIEDSLSAYNAVIDADKCIDCNVCHKICQQNNPAPFKKPIAWYQGWAVNPNVRKSCSSGGLATAISEAFVNAGGVVCSCVFQNGEFIFELVEKQDELYKFVGSKYVKSNPAGIYKKVKEYAANGRKVLFIGLPCQVSALKKIVGEQYEERVFTVDLICHGTPSPKMLEIFLDQYGYSLSNLQDIQFRVKAKFMVLGDHKGVITDGVSDKYSIAFLNSLTYTENCYSCQYARIERVSDLTLGDSWGSELPLDEQKKGISLILRQNEKGGQLLQMAQIHLEAVNLDRAIKNNHQLSHPSVKPQSRDKFYKMLNKRRFNDLIFRIFPKQCLRQDVKQVLIRARIIKGGGKKAKLIYSIKVLSRDESTCSR